MPDPVVGYDTIVAGDLPESVANFDSLAAFAATTEEDWNNQLFDAEENRWGVNGVLGGFFDGLVNAGSFVLSLLQTLADTIFGGITFIFESVEDALTELGNNFAAWWGSITRASTAGVVSSASGLAGAVSGGVALSDEFDRGVASTLGADYQLYSDGSGAGTFGTNLLGTAVWQLSGGLRRRHVSRRTTTLATDYQFVSVVTASTLPPLFNSSQIYLCARMNAAATQPDLDCVYLRFGANSMAFGHVIDGVFTDFSVSVTSKRIYAGDEIQFFVGTDDDDREFIAKVNGAVVVSYIDSADVSVLGGKFVGVGAESMPYSLLQKEPFRLKVWAASDRLAAAT